MVYSDGLTDAQNQREEMFGEEKLLKIIQQEAPSGSHALEQKLLKAVAEFTEGMPQTDDITFVVVEKWESTDALKAHAAAPHMAAYGAKTRDLIASRVIHILSPA